MKSTLHGYYNVDLDVIYLIFVFHEDQYVAYLIFFFTHSKRVPIKHGHRYEFGIKE